MTELFGRIASGDDIATAAQETDAKLDAALNNYLTAVSRWT